MAFKLEDLGASLPRCWELPCRFTTQGSHLISIPDCLVCVRARTPHIRMLITTTEQCLGTLHLMDITSPPQFPAILPWSSPVATRCWRHHRAAGAQCTSLGCPQAGPGSASALCICERGHAVLPSALSYPFWRERWGG